MSTSLMGDRDRSRRSGGGGGGGAGGSRSDRGDSYDDRERSPVNSDFNKRIIVKNIPTDYRWQDLKDIFRTIIGLVEFVETFVENGESAAIVEFHHASDVDKAVEKMNGFKILEQPITVSRHTGRSSGHRRMHRRGGRGAGGTSDRDDKSMNTRGGGRGGRGDSYGGDGGGSNASANDGPYNTYGLSTSFLDSLGIRGPLHSKVFITNLDYHVGAKKVKQIFKLAGKIINLDLSIDKEGNSRGFGIIEYEHPVEAVQAVSLFDQQLLYDRRMTVRIDRMADKEEGFQLPEGLAGIGMGLGPNGEPFRNVAKNLPKFNEGDNNNFGNNNNFNNGMGGGGNNNNNNINNNSNNNMGMNNMGMNNNNMNNNSNMNMGGNMNNMGGGSGGGGVGMGMGMNQNTMPAPVQPPSSIDGNSMMSLTNLNSMGGMGGGGGSGSGGFGNSSGLGSGGGGGGGGIGSGGTVSLLGTDVNVSGFNSSMGGSGGGGGSGSGVGNNNLGGGGGLNSGYSTSLFNTQGSRNDYETTTQNNQNIRGYNSGGGGGGGGQDDFLQQSQSKNQLQNNYQSMNDGGQNSNNINSNNNSNSENQVVSDTIIIKNLPTSCTWQTLRDKFNDIGEVKFAEIRNDVGVIRFVKERDAELALKLMDGARFDGRNIRILFF